MKTFSYYSKIKITSYNKFTFFGKNKNILTMKKTGSTVSRVNNGFTLDGMKS